MKTLDEVIKNLEDGTEHLSAMLISKETWSDALSYLNEYKELSKMWNDKLDKEQENPPLDWETLKQMEGKPVWVESSDSLNRRRWMFVGEWFDEDEMRLFDMGNDYPDYVSKNGYESGTWQAYRKERG